MSRLLTSPYTTDCRTGVICDDNEFGRAHVLDRIFIIGLGGSAETMVRYLNSYLEQRLLGLGWKRGMPAAWRWLCVDIAEDSDVVTGDVPKELGRTGRRIGLAKNPYEYRNYFDQLTTRGPATLAGLQGSVPDPSVEVPPPFKGAGQRPQVGYAIGLAQLKEIATAIDREIIELNGPTATSELTDLSRHMRRLDAPGGPGTRLFVVSSLCGGSGAGLLQLVVELLLGRAVAGAEWQRHELATILFTPDVFVDLKRSEREGINANALYTVASMLNGYEATGVAPAGLTQLLVPGGAVLDQGRRAAVTNFFVGGSNDSISFNSQHGAIKAASKAIVRTILDAEVAGGLSAHLEANRVGATVTSDFRIVDPTATSRAASSLGYASVSLGGSVIASYTAERVAREAIDTLLQGHRRWSTPGEREDDAIDRLARELHDQFMSGSGLTQEAVLDELRNRPVLRHQVQDRVEAIKDDIRSSRRRDTPATQWLARVESEVAAMSQQVEEDRAVQREEAVRSWSESVSETLQAATASCIARYGIPVTLRLLEAARTQTGESASVIGRDRRERLLPEAEERAERGRRILTSLGESKLDSRDSRIEQATDWIAQAMFLRTDAEDHALAEKILRELDGGVLVPLRSAVGNAAKALMTSKESRHGALVSRWSTTVVPPRLSPAPNELLLESEQTFPGLVDDLLQETLGCKGVKNATAQAVAELVVGEWPRRDGESNTRQTLIDCPGQWYAATGITGSADYRLNVLDVEAVLELARDWTRQRRGELGERLALSIAEWMEQDPDRPDQLADKLGEALRFAVPLTNISGAVYMRVHGATPAPPKLFVSPIPIAAGHRIRGRIEQILLDAGIADGESVELFDPTSSTGVIEVSGFTAEPMHPVVLAGLFVPIQRDWQERVNPAMRQQFSSYRRTRPLPLHVPLSPARQKAFARGWFLAEAYDLIRLPSSGSADRSIAVDLPSGRVTFPEHLLGAKPRDMEELFACVLESLSLALARFACQQWQELEAYMATLDFGALDHSRGWVANGHSETGESTPGYFERTSGIGLNGTSPEDHQAAIRRLTEIERRWRARVDERGPLTREGVSKPDRASEVADLALSALVELLSPEAGAAPVRGPVP